MFRTRRAEFVIPPILAVCAAALYCTVGVGAHPQVGAPYSLQTRGGMVTVERLAKLDNPWGMTYLPDGRLLITEKPGRLRVYADGKLSEPIVGTPNVVYRGQSGLMDVEIDPQFASNQLIYLSYVEAAVDQPSNAKVDPDKRLGGGGDRADTVLKGAAVARGRLVGEQIRDLKVIWRQEPKKIGMGHFGGSLVFAPDGKLFIMSGDRQRFEPARDLGTNIGKVVRINSDGTIPHDNPFKSRPGARPDIWSQGHRNQLGAAINPTSNQLWLHEMGPAHGDELNAVERGKDYGWPVVSNGNNYDGSKIPDHDTQLKFAAPAFHWHPAISPAGLAFYTGDRFKGWKGNALIGALSSQCLLRLTLDGNKVTGEERLMLNKRIRDVIQAPDGAVMVLTDGGNGELLRLTPATS